MASPVIISAPEAAGFPTLTGDVLFVRAPGLFSGLIAWATKGRREPVTLATHQAMFEDCGALVHATGRRGVHRQTWASYSAECARYGKQWAIVRRVQSLDGPEKASVRAALAESVGWHYSWPELALQLADGILAKLQDQRRIGLDVLVFRRLGDLWMRGVVCSGTANRPLVRIGALPPEYRYAAPDDTWDCLYRRNSGWRLVARTPGWFRR